MSRQPVMAQQGTYLFPVGVRVKFGRLKADFSYSFKHADGLLALKAVQGHRKSSGTYYADEGNSREVGSFRWAENKDLYLHDRDGEVLGIVKPLGGLSFYELPDFEIRDGSNNLVARVAFARRWMKPLNWMIAMTVGGLLPWLLNNKYMRPIMTVQLEADVVLRVKYAASLSGGKCMILKEGRFANEDQEKLVMSALLALTPKYLL